MARERALSIYRRPFLDSTEYEWCAQVRRSLEETLVDLLHTQAQYTASRGARREDALDEAESLYGRALSVDPYDERAHRGIMWCRSMRGDRSGAMRQFQECKEILADEMGISPEKETVSLYVTLLEGSEPIPPPA